MAIYERSTVVDAPFEDVWEFHSRIDGLVALTPDWMNLRVAAVRGPDGDSEADVLDVGSEVSLSVRPFGIGPRRSWTSRIVARERQDDVAYFRDRMRNGPFAEWVHTHRFRAVAEGTRITDHVEYELGRPFGALSGLAYPFFEPMFRYRHRRTRTELE